MPYTPALLQSGEILRSGFDRYKIIDRENNPELPSTPDHTPTVTTYRLARIPPQLYRARDVSGKQVAVKVVSEESLLLLINEWKALERLKWLQYLPFFKKITPSLRNSLSYDAERKIYFFVVDWLDKKYWKNLGEIVATSPLCFLPDAEVHMRKLRLALFTATKTLHFIGIIHGDGKDEHVYLLEKDGQVFFDQLRLIDFGECYLNPLDDWKGGSLGFSSPYFWNNKHRQSLSRREMMAIDWYGVYSILYYTYTGECFPAASPAFSKMSDLEFDRHSQNYYRELEVVLLNKWQNYPDNVQMLISESVKYLCAPDALFIPDLRGPRMSF